MKCKKCKDGTSFENAGTVEGFAGFRCTECGKVGKYG